MRVKSAPSPKNSQSSQGTVSKAAGFTYIEVIVAVTVLAVCLIPAMDALRSSMTLLGIQETISIDHYALLSKTEEVLKESFTDQDFAATEAGSATISINSVTAPISCAPLSPFLPACSDVFATSDGRHLTRNVYIGRMDGDNADLDSNIFTGTDPGILYVKVAIADSVLSHETIVVRE